VSKSLYSVFYSGSDGLLFVDRGILADRYTRTLQFSNDFHDLTDPATSPPK
jgi:hypothetical protein